MSLDILPYDILQNIVSLLDYKTILIIYNISHYYNTFSKVKLKEILYYMLCTTVKFNIKNDSIEQLVPLTRFRHRYVDYRHFDINYLSVNFDKRIWGEQNLFCNDVDYKLNKFKLAGCEMILKNTCVCGHDQNNKYLSVNNCIKVKFCDNQFNDAVRSVHLSLLVRFQNVIFIHPVTTKHGETKGSTILINLSKRLFSTLPKCKTVKFTPLFSIKLYHDQRGYRLMIKMIDLEMISISPINFHINNYTDLINLRDERIQFGLIRRIIPDNCKNTIRYNIKIRYTNNINIIKILYRYDTTDHLVIREPEMTSKFGILNCGCKQEQGANLNKQEHQIRVHDLNIFSDLHNYVATHLAKTGYKIKPAKNYMRLSLINDEGIGKSLFVDINHNILDWNLITFKTITFIPFILIRGILIIDKCCYLRTEIKKAIVTNY